MVETKNGKTKGSLELPFVLRRLFIYADIE